MTAVGEPGTRPPAVAGAAAVWAGRFRRRLREPAFWIVQAAVVSITVLHVAVEAFRLFASPPLLESGLHHVPVVLYLVPIVYAGLRYGFEGAVLTSAWCFLLTIPNVLVWHAREFRWVGEFLYVSFVVGVGLVVALPVERERRERDRAVAVGRRLALLHEVTSALVSSASIDRALGVVLGRLRDVLGLEAAGVASWDAGASGPQMWWSPSAALRNGGVSLLPGDARLLGDGLADLEDGVLAAPLRRGDGGPAGALLVIPGRPRALGPEDEELVLAVAGQIGVALDNVRLHAQERDRLRSYVHEVTRAQEEERKRLARELHDTAAQDLVRLCRGLDTLVGEADGGRLAGLRAVAGEVLESLRRMSRDLRPTVLDDLGLVPALEWLVTDLRQRTGIGAEFRLTGPARRLPAEAELALFRITQEALRNVERHARASTVVVSAEFQEAGVRLEIADDGRGFVVPDPPERLAQSGKLGLVGMYERAQLVGGRLEIASRPRRGSRVTVVLEGRPEPPLGREAVAGSGTTTAPAAPSPSAPHPS